MIPATDAAQALYPFRSIQWRWERIKDLYDRRSRPSRADDGFIHEGFRFYCDYHGSQDAVLSSPIGEGEEDGRSLSRRVEDRNQRIMRAHPCVWAALHLHASQDERRYAIEAMVLAGADVELIAGNVPCAPEIVHAYESLFYDVRSRMSARVFVYSELINKRRGQGGAGRSSPDYLWKWLAYEKGIETLFAYWSGGPMSRTMRDQFDTMHESQLRRDVAQRYCR